MLQLMVVLFWATAFWISDKCLKIVFDSLDNLVPSPFDVKVANQIMCDYFKVNFTSVLPLILRNFQYSSSRQCLKPDADFWQAKDI